MTKSQKSTITKNVLASNFYKYIRKCIDENRSIDKRIEEIEKGGFDISNEVPMGSGGVGQIKVMRRLNEVRIQVTCGHGVNNYAKAVVLDLAKVNFLHSPSTMLKTLINQDN